MAIPNIPIDNSLFLLAEAEIRSLFSLLLSRVSARRDELLADLHERWAVFVDEIKTRNNTLKDLEKMREHFTRVSIKENFAVQIQEASLQGIERQMLNLKKRVFETPRIRFIESLSEEIMEKVSKMGVLVEQTSPSYIPIDYSKKIKPVRSIGSRGSEPGQFINPNRIFINIESDKLFVTDPGNRRIQILSLDGKPITQFGEAELKYPVSVAASNDYCYVSDHTQNSIMRYNLANLKFIDRQSSTVGGVAPLLKFPRGLVVSEDEVLVADHSHRVCVFDYNLRFKRDFGAGILQFPQYIQLRDGFIFVLDRNDPCLHMFCKEGDKICSIISRGFGKEIRDGVSFCFDMIGNIIIADCGGERVRVFSSRGDLVHTICVRNPETDIGVCWGVGVAGTQLFVSQGTGKIDIF